MLQTQISKTELASLFAYCQLKLLKLLILSCHWQQEQVHELSHVTAADAAVEPHALLLCTTLTTRHQHGCTYFEDGDWERMIDMVVRLENQLSILSFQVGTEDAGQLGVNPVQTISRHVCKVSK